ncbi:MAG: AtpZ/AtpI family protein [Epsilonproteobacteria bacterium]|nr:AtpZ/AtpI family protein [Campylobacterota bacterium]
MEENKKVNEEIIKEEKPKHKDKIEALDNLSLGISIAVALAFGIGLGLLLKEWSGYTWTLWVGVFYGVAAAVLNVYKAYKKAKASLDELADDPKYKYQAEYGINKIDEN